MPHTQDPASIKRRRERALRAKAMELVLLLPEDETEARHVHALMEELLGSYLFVPPSDAVEASVPPRLTLCEGGR